MKKRKIIFCAIAEPVQQGIVETYELARVYGFEYIRAFSLSDPEIKKRCDIEILSFPHDPLDEEIIDTVVLERPEIVGFSCSLKNYYCTMDITRQIKLASPETLIVIGGPEVFAPERIMEKHPSIDFAVIGEGEETFRELLSGLIHKTGPEGIAGLCYRKSGKPVRNKPRNPIADINVLPVIITPARTAGFSGVVLYETSRGCRHNCSYCLWSPYPKRYFSLGRVKKELKNLLENKNISRIWFIDSDFDSDPGRAVAILRYIKDNNTHGTKISAFLSFTSPDAELLSLAGELCHEVPVGLQTINRRSLRALGRSWFDVARFENALPDILRHIPANRLYIDLMYGLPHETPDVFFDTLLWCVRRGLTHINFFRLGIYPGTDIERNAAKHRYVFDSEPPHLVYGSDSFSYDDLLIIENAIVNFKILTRIFSPGDMVSLDRALDLRAALVKLNEGCDWWETCFTRINESNIANIDAAKAAPQILGYLKKNIRDARLLRVFREKIAENIERTNDKDRPRPGA